MVQLLSVSPALSLRADAPVLKVVGVDHVAISVADPEKSVTFYRATLGQEIFKPANQRDRYFLSLGGRRYVAIAKQAATPAGTIDHFCIAVENQKSEMKAALDGLNIPSTDGAAELQDLFIKDPDGIRIQLARPGESNPANDVLKHPKIAQVAGARSVFTPKGLDHISVTVTNLDRSVAFYRKLGKETRRREDRVFFQLGNASVVVKQAQKSEKIGADHFCVAVANSDMEAAAKLLKPLGTEMKRWQPTDPPYFTDPDGVIIQVTTAK